MIKKWNKVEDSYLLISIFFLILTLLIPLSFGDDLDWGGISGIERLNNFFDNYNGRYLGNLTIIGISRFMWLRILLYVVVNTSLVMLINKISDTEHIVTKYFSLFVVLSMPARVYGQTFGWYSGFANYNMGMFFTLLLIYLLLGNKNITFIFMTSFIGQLFMENISIYNLFMILYFILFFKEIPFIKKIVALLGGSLGAFWMFSNSVYRTIATGEDYYRQIDFQKISQVLMTDYMNFYLIDNWLMLSILALGIVILTINEKELLAHNILMVSYVLFVILLNNGKVSLSNATTPLLLFTVIFSVIFLINFIFIINKSDYLKNDNKKILFLGLSSGIILAPFLIIEPFGPRAEFTSYLFFAMIIVIIFDKIFIKYHQINLKKYITYLSLTVSLFYIFIHASNLIVFNTRMNHPVIDKESKIIYVTDMPYGQYGQHLTPEMDLTISPRTFREKYKISEDYDIIFESYQSRLLK